MNIIYELKMLLVITCHFSYITDDGKLKFTYLDTKTLDKLTRACTGDYKPYSKSEFTVKLPGYKNIPEDISNLVGLTCKITIQPRNYNFVSNKISGERISGTTFVLKNIVRAN